MMERELLRHIRKRDKESDEALSKAHKKHPIEALSLLELPPKKELEEKCFESLQENWEKFKELFNVERLPLVGSIDNVVDWYFQVEAPFSEKKKKEFPDAFILSVLDEYHREHHGAHIAVISKDKDFSNACMTRRYLHNFQEISEYIKAFEPELSRKDNGLPTNVIESLIFSQLGVVIMTISLLTLIVLFGSIHCLRRDILQIHLTLKDLMMVEYLSQIGCQ